MIARCALLLWLIASVTVSARDIHVDHVDGDDAATGSAEGPLQTIKTAIKQAEAGDVIHLRAIEGKPVREVIEFYAKSGQPGKPIVLDGHGAVVDGTESLDPSNWKEVSRGLWRCDNLYQRTNHGKHMDKESIRAVTGRFFMVFDGEVNHMGRSMKGVSQPFKIPKDLEEGQWTFVEEEVAFYIRTDGKQSLKSYNIELPLRVNGVAIYGERCEHLAIRNLAVRRVYNDGFNIHGSTRGIYLKNVKAIECGDDGISAHDDCQIWVDGFESVGNSTGFCHTGASRTRTRRAIIRNCLGVDVYVLGSGFHELCDSIIQADAYKPVIVGGEKNTTCTLQLHNVLVGQGACISPIRVQPGGVLQCRNTTIDGISVVANGRSVILEHCVVTGQDSAEIVIYPETTFDSMGNIYDIRSIRIGDKPAQPVYPADTSCTPDKVHSHERCSGTAKRLPRTFGPANIDQYRSYTGDTRSQWHMPAPTSARSIPKGVGFDQDKACIW